MCHFITATHSANFSLTDLNKIAEPFVLKFQDCNNDFVRKQILKDEKYIYKHTKMCDCGTSIGTASDKEVATERVQKSELDSLKKKGWTDTKINRWIQDRKKYEEKMKQQNESILNKKSNEIENWLSFIQALFKLTNIEHFGLLLHWYSKGVENENIQIRDRKIVSYKNLIELDFKTLQEDTLLTVTK